MMLYKKKNSRFGRYPSCDMLNNAIRFLLDGKDRNIVIEEIVHAIRKADGYIYDDLQDRVDKIMKDQFERRLNHDCNSC